MNAALNKKITSLFDYIIKNSYDDYDINQKFCDLEEHINENKQSTSYVETGINRLFDVDFELYIRSMNYVIEKSLYELEILFLRVAISNSNCFRDLHNDSTCFKLIRNTIKILLNCQLQDYLDITMSEKFIIGKDDTKLISYQNLEASELVNLLNLSKYKYIKILTNDICHVDENQISSYIKKLGYVYNYFKSLDAIPTNLAIFSLGDISYSKNNVETLFNNMSYISPTEYDIEMFNKYGILLLPYISDIKISNSKLSFLNSGFGILENGVLQILSNDNQILNSYKIQTTFFQNEVNVYLELTPILQDLDPNSNIFFKIISEKFSKKYIFIFMRTVGKLYDGCKSESGEMVTKIEIGNIGNDNILNIGNGDQKVSILHSMKELDELIQKLKTSSLGEYAEQLEDAQKSNDVKQIKTILNKLKDVVSGSAEMAGMITKIIPILDLLKNSTS